MAKGYHIHLPDGRVQRITIHDEEERNKICQELLEEWGEYCNRNWINEDGSPYSPGAKVKTFLDSIAMVMLPDAASEDIETDYKDKMRGSREIPMSSCPTYVEDVVYGRVSPSGNAQVAADTDTFRNTIGAEPVKTKKKPKQKKVDRFTKFEIWKNENSVADTHRCYVNTDGEFSFHGVKYSLVLEKLPQYQVKVLPNGDELYDMDYVLIGIRKDGTVCYADCTFHDISPEFVKRV